MKVALFCLAFVGGIMAALLLSIAAVLLALIVAWPFIFLLLLMPFWVAGMCKLLDRLV